VTDHPARRRRAVATLAVASIVASALAGCATAAGASNSPDLLTWRGAVGLGVDDVPGWNESLVTTADWKPDAALGARAEGRWGYSSASTGCTLLLVEGHAGYELIVPDDDRATTDALMGTLWGAAWPALRSSAEQRPLSVAHPGSQARLAKASADGVLVRGIGARAGVEVWARAYGKPGVITYLMGTCPEARDLAVVERALAKVSVSVARR
jgi:hypothetical protein